MSVLNWIELRVLAILKLSSHIIFIAEFLICFSYFLFSVRSNIAVFVVNRKFRWSMYEKKLISVKRLAFHWLVSSKTCRVLSARTAK